MSRLTDLIVQAKARDPQLGADLEREFQALSQRRAFGLNFERHQPEAVELPQRAMRKGDKVRILSPRGSTRRGDHRLWSVKRIETVDGVRLAHLDLLRSAEPETQWVPVDDLVVVAEFRDLMYPGLRGTGRLERGGDKPFHTVLNAENSHALKALLFTHRNRVDVIYIDPPYNTGARDWKYNNDYVEADDHYRHSKWLAFIERRLLLAKDLLRPEDSVLIVTIDEKEYLRLGLLLEQVFPEADIQMVTSVTNRAGSSRGGRFSRVDEYIYYVLHGDAQIAPWTSTMLSDPADSTETPVMSTVWFTAVRRGTASALRSARPALFYPVILDRESGRLVRVGDPIPREADRTSYEIEPGRIAIWPLASDGKEQTWRFSADRMREYFAAGTARLGKRNPLTGQRPITYLQPGTLANISNGTFVVTGRSPEGALELSLADGAAKRVTPRTVWNKTSHFARDHGSTLLNALLGEKRFDFPKSLYAVEDTLRFVLTGKPDAVVVDFFAGSGTTAHAVMRLNRQLGGQRTSVSVTNNEVSAEEQLRLSSAGHRPGDQEWEDLGIFQFVTKPRLEAAVTGRKPSGAPIAGDYRFTDEFAMSDGFEENVEFFDLTYESPVAVSHTLAFARIAPLLWMRAGSVGRRISEVPASGWEVADTYGVLIDLDKATAFCAAVEQANGLRIAYVVTDDDRRYQAVARRLPNTVDTVRLWESYLANFRFSNGD